MADSQAFTRIWRSIWSDLDFTGMDSDAMVAYFVLISNGEAGHAGLMTIAVNRWAAQAGMSTDQMWAALRTLDAARFVVLDESTDELLVRTRMRNDTFVKGPWQNQMSGLRGAHKAVSPTIRSVLAYEVTRLLPLITNPEVRAFAERVIGELETDTDPGIDPRMDLEMASNERSRPADPQTLRPGDPADPHTPIPTYQQTGRSADPETFQSVTLGRGVWGEGVLTRECEHCGAEFEAKHSTAKYCSNSCRQKAYRSREEQP
jgi:hypothetical protein